MPANLYSLYKNGILPYSEKADATNKFFRFGHKGSKVFCDDIKLFYTLYSWDNECYGRPIHSIFFEFLFEPNIVVQDPNYYRILMCSRGPSLYVAPTQYITPHNILNQVFLDKLYRRLVSKELPSDDPR